MLEIEGCIVTVDAMHCQTETAKTIIGKGADYVLPVKENQPRLLDSLRLLFDDPEEMRWVACDHHRTVNKGHGRIEIRECWTTSDPEYLRHIDTLAEWKGLRSIAMVQVERRLGEERTTTRSSSSPVLRAMRSSCCMQCEPIGASKTRCFGYKTVPSARTIAAFERAMARRTWRPVPHCPEPAKAGENGQTQPERQAHEGCLGQGLPAQGPDRINALALQAARSPLDNLLEKGYTCCCVRCNKVA